MMHPILRQEDERVRKQELLAARLTDHIALKLLKNTLAREALDLFKSGNH